MCLPGPTSLTRVTSLLLLSYLYLVGSDHFLLFYFLFFISLFVAFRVGAGSSSSGNSRVFISLLLLICWGRCSVVGLKLLLGQCGCDMGMLLDLWASAGWLCFLCLQMFYHQILCGDGMDCCNSDGVCMWYNPWVWYPTVKCIVHDVKKSFTGCGLKCFVRKTGWF